jgi:hypothetical protein
MTLEDKIYKTLINNPDTYPVQQIEKITDDFAINFEEWVTQQPKVKILKKSGLDNSYMRMSSKELLQIYKKEKGL